MLHGHVKKKIYPDHLLHLNPMGPLQVAQGNYKSCKTAVE